MKRNVVLFVGIAIGLSMALMGCDLLDTNRQDDSRAIDNGIDEITICNPVPYKEVASIPLTRSQKSSVTGGNDFAFKMLGQINSRSESSFIFSPMSVALDLSMVAAGTSDSAEEILNALGYEGKDVSELNAYCKAIIEGLAAVDLSTKFKLSNAVLVCDAFSVKDSFKKTIQDNYYGAVEAMPFSDKDKTLRIINEWVNKNTEGLITQLLDNINPQTLACMLNAVYFKAQWQNQFNPELTNDGIFHSPDEDVTTAFMTQQLNCGYAENDLFSCVSLPLGEKGRFSMTMVLPGPGKKINDIIKEIQNTGWESLTGSMKNEDVIVKIPKLSLNSKFELIPLLESVGIKRVFSGANFDIMLEQEPAILRIHEAFQKATITLDENGIEAAAATYFGMKGIMPLEHKQYSFTADRPYVFCIHENSSKAIIFAGVNNGHK